MGFPAVSTQDGTALSGLGPGKPLALLVYLAVRREARREELVDLLWGEVAESNARNAFRQALHRLRTALGEDLVPPDRERVGLSETEAIWIDRDAFLAALDRGDVTAAVELYRGEFLEGFELGEAVFDSWVDAERVRLRANSTTTRFAPKRRHRVPAYPRPPSAKPSLISRTDNRNAGVIENRIVAHSEIANANASTWEFNPSPARYGM